MPKQEISIKSFDSGMINVIDSEDMPIESAMYSVNVDPTSRSSMLMGVKDSIERYSPETIVKGIAYDTETATALATIDNLGMLRIRENWTGGFQEVADDNIVAVGANVTSVQEAIGSLHLGNASKIAIVEDDGLALYEDQCPSLSITNAAPTTYGFKDGFFITANSIDWYVGYTSESGTLSVYNLTAATNPEIELEVSTNSYIDGLFYLTDYDNKHYFIVILGNNTFSPTGTFNGSMVLCYVASNASITSGSLVDSVMAPLSFSSADDKPTYNLDVLKIQDIKLNASREPWVLLGGEGTITSTSYGEEGELRILFKGQDALVDFVANGLELADKTPGFTKVCNVPTGIVSSHYGPLGDEAFQRGISVKLNASTTAFDVKYWTENVSSPLPIISFNPSSSEVEQDPYTLYYDLGWEETASFYIPPHSLSISGDRAAFPVKVSNGNWVKGIELVLYDDAGMDLRYAGITPITRNFSNKILLFSVDENFAQTNNTIFTKERDISNGTYTNTFNCFTVLKQETDTEKTAFDYSLASNTERIRYAMSNYQPVGAYNQISLYSINADSLQRVTFSYQPSLANNGNGVFGWHTEAGTTVTSPFVNLDIDGHVQLAGVDSDGLTTIAISQRDDFNKLYSLDSLFSISSTATELLKGSLSVTVSCTPEATDTNRFNSNTEYGYRVAALYDGYQEGALSSEYLLTLEDDSGETQFCETVTIALTKSASDQNNRIKAVLLFRRDDDSPYRLVGKASFDSTNDQVIFVDYFPTSISYEALTGVPETLEDPFIEYSYSLFENGYMFAIGKGVKDSTNVGKYVFRSIAGKPSVYNWTQDYVILPFKPLALTSFNGRIIALGKNNVCTIDPEGLYMERLETGIGIGTIESFCVTSLGVFLANKNNAWIYDGFKAQEVGTALKGERITRSPIIRYDTIFWSSKVQAVYSAKDDIVFLSCAIDPASGGYTGTSGIAVLLTYSISSQKWEVIDPVKEGAPALTALWRTITLFADREGGVFCAIDDSPNGNGGGTKKKLKDYTNELIPST